MIVEAPYLQKDNLCRADRARLEDRIHDAAWEACRQLDRRYPPSVYIPETSRTQRQCAERAADDGMAQAHMIADARAARSHDGE